MHDGGNRIYGPRGHTYTRLDYLQNSESLTIFKDFVVQRQGLVVRGQWLRSNSKDKNKYSTCKAVLDLEDKDFARGQQHWHSIVHLSSVRYTDLVTLTWSIDKS